MVERLRVLHFPLEPGREGRVVADQSPRQHLHRAQTALGGAGEVDGTHAALAEHGLEPVAGELGAQLRSAGHSSVRS